MKNSDETLWFLSSLLGSVSVAKAFILRDHQHLIRAPCPLWAVPSFVVPLPHTLLIQSTWKVLGILEYIPISHPKLPFLLCSFPLWKFVSLPTPFHLALPEPQLFSAGTEVFSSAFTNPCSWLKCLIFPLLFSCI